VAIYARRWEPDGPPRGVVLVVHGYAEHVGRYQVFAEHLTARGVAVAGIDHRGHGRSGGNRGHCRDFAEYVTDVRALADAAERWWPGRQRVLFGHSLGGLIALCYLLAHPDTVVAGALSAPALRVPDAGSAMRRRVARILGLIAPRMTFRSNLDAGALSRDPSVGRAYVADPLVHRAATAGFVRAVEAAQAQVQEGAPRLRVPLLLLQGDADRIVDPTAAAELAARLRCPHEMVRLEGYYHELLNEPAPERARVLQVLDAWIDRWLGV
jgi:alpha-beta hydrolase superfamily lysophospholipase